MKTINHKILIFSGIILVITFSVLLIIKFGYLTQSPVKLPLYIPTPSPSAKLYANPKFGFSFQYPSFWKISSWDLNEVSQLTNLPEGSINFQVTVSDSSGKAEVLVWKNTSKMSVDKWISYYLRQEIDQTQVPQEANDTVNNLPAWRFVSENKARKTLVEYVFVQKEDYIFEILFERKDIEGVTGPPYQKMLDTFQFINGDDTAVIVEEAKTDLVTRYKVPKDKILIEKIEKVDWPNSALGCPEPGMRYAQVITPGYKIILRVTDMLFEYHSDLGKRVVFCPQS